MNKTINVYIVHDPSLEYRLQTCYQALDQAFGNINTINGYVANRFTPEQAKLALKDNIVLPNNTLNLRTVSNSLNHLDALNSIRMSSGPDDINLVVEDDLVISRCQHGTYTSKCSERMQRLLASLPVSYDIIWLGGDRIGYEETVERISSTMFLSTESYVITKKAANLLVDNYFPFGSTHSIHMRHLIDRLGLTVYRSCNSFFSDGSKTGLYVGTVNADDYNLDYNQRFREMKSIVDNPHATSADLQHASVQVLHNPEMHPHFRYLIAKLFMKQRDYDSAMMHMNFAMDGYKQMFKNPWKLHAFLLEYIFCCKMMALCSSEKPQ